MLENINEIIDVLNEKYEVNDNKGQVPFRNRSSISNFRVIKGNLPILISAPHAVVQHRTGFLKEADSYTGAICEYVCKKTGAFGIIREWYAIDDPNHNGGPRSQAYRDEVADIIENNDIKVLIDLHGFSKANHEYFGSKRVVVGTNFGKNINWNYDVTFVFKKIFGDDLLVDKTFAASNNNSVSKNAHINTCVSAYQLELESSLRKPGIRRVRTVKKLVKLVNEINKEIIVREK